MTPTEDRLALRRNGYHPLPVEGKRPPLKGWEEKFNTNDEEIRFWSKTWCWAHNTGANAKFTPGLDIDILDLAAAEAVEALAREHFEERGNILVRIGLPPKRLIPLRTDEPFKKLRCEFISPNGDEHKIEVLGDGQQWVAYGIHPDTGKPYGWHGGELATTKREALPYVRLADMQKFLDDAVRLLVEEFDYSLKETNDADDGKPREPGEPQASIERISAALDVIPNDDKDWDAWNAIGMAVWRATGGSPEGFAAFNAWSAKSAKYDPGTTKTRWDGYFRSPPTIIGAGTIFFHADQASPGWWKKPPPEPESEPGPEPEPGPQPPPATPPVFDPWARYIVPPFPFEILPSVVQKFVSAEVAVIGFPSAMAMSVLGTFSGALHHGMKLKMFRNGNWYASPRLWILLVAPPSWKKTPTFNAAMQPLVHYEAHKRAEYQTKLYEYEKAKERGEDAEEPEPPPRYLTWDTTVEKLGELLTYDDGRKGILVLADELSGWLGSMERYSNSKGGRSDRAFWLKAYDGGPYCFDRIGRGEIYIQNLSVSILGGIQPDRLAELHKLTSDGLLQRFIPVMGAAPVFRLDRPSDHEAYDKLVRQMIFAKPVRLIMTEEALAVMEGLHRHLFNLGLASEGLADGFSTFVGKLDGVAGSLALILHMAHFLEHPTDSGSGIADPVGERTVEKVRQLVLDFILPHAREFYCGAGTTSGESLRRLASWVLTSGKHYIVASDLTSNVAECRGLTLRDLNDRVSPLVACGWLDPADNALLCKRWTFNPQVRVQLAERARTEEAQKAALAQLMGSPRGPGKNL